MSESRSENVSNDGKPPRVDDPKDSKEVVNCDSCLISPPNINLCSSSSPEHNVGSEGKSSGRLLELAFGDSTVRVRGSQKSKCDSDVTERGIGEGDGERQREGHALAERRSDAWVAVTEGG